MYVTICGEFGPDKGVVAGYDNRIRVKYTTKWGVQIAGMFFQTGSRPRLFSANSHHLSETDWGCNRDLRFSGYPAISL